MTAAPGWLWLAAIGTAGIVLLLALPFRLGVFFAYSEKAARLSLCVGVAPALSFRVQVPVEPLGKRSQAARRGRASGPSANRWPVRVFLRLFGAARSVERLEWRTVLGAGDAALTSYLIGTAWAFKAALLAGLRRRFAFRHPPRYAVIPDFERIRVALELSCIIRLSIGDVILALLKR